jgi:hypothetical protein
MQVIGRENPCCAGRRSAASLMPGGAPVMIVEKLGEFFAQALVAFGCVAEHDSPLEQLMLHRLRQVAPGGDHRMAQARENSSS